ncbi:D-alanyl-D-alanine carboxypeptidase family protein [Apilactobacillus nanyangensis]|uniref:D-alanyl-D-alanine carboxypeptidase family protein n=1 Tax=Apilactobacillus nanyangensis TaxID=2799579 RepID=UPI001942CAA8|nr:serine hydrolase [Apilactobacillus nanyangensis]
MKKSVKRLAIIFVAAIGLGAYEQFNNPFSFIRQEYTKLTNNKKGYQPNYQQDRQTYKTDLLKMSQDKVENASAAVALDATKNKVIYSQNGDKKIKVASLAKLMTLYLTIQKAEKTNGWNQVVDTSSKGLKELGSDVELGGFKFKDGHKYTVRDLYKAALVQSSNNSAIALGQWVAGGSNVKFIKMMNEQAKAWHLDATFVSSSGLENSDLAKFGYAQVGGKDDANMISAKSIAIIADHVLSIYPKAIDDAKQVYEKVDGQTLFNENSLLPGRPFYDESLHVDGLKTGYTVAAGLCLVATAQQPGKDRVITVVVNDYAEFSDTAKLIKLVNNHDSSLK